MRVQNLLLIAAVAGVVACTAGASGPSGNDTNPSGTDPAASGEAGSPPPATVDAGPSGSADGSATTGGACPCSAGNYCDLATNTCKSGCLSDKECKAGEYCDPNARTCKTGCSSAKECDVGGSCTNHQCTCAANARSCGGTCAVCPAGATQPSCCGATCVDLARDKANCGTCGNNCDTSGVAHGANPGASSCRSTRCVAPIEWGDSTLETCAMRCAAAQLSCSDALIQSLGLGRAGNEGYVTQMNGICQIYPTLAMCNDYPPSGYSCIGVMGTGKTESSTPFGGSCNCL